MTTVSTSKTASGAASVVADQIPSMPLPIGLSKKRKVAFAQPPAKISTTTIAPKGNYDEEEEEAPPKVAANGSEQQTTAAESAVGARASSSANSNAAVETVSRRPNDIVYQLNEPRSEFMPPSLEPSSAAFASTSQRQEDDASVSLSNVLPMKTYNQAQRFLIQGTLQAANFVIPREQNAGNGQQQQQQPPPPSSTKEIKPRQNISAQASTGVLQSAFAQAQQPQVGVSTAAYVNHFTRTLLNRGFAAGDSAASLRPTPYVTDSASTYVTTFVSAAIDEAPGDNAAEYIPNDEQRAHATAITYDWMVSFQRSVRPGEFACAKGNRCWGMTLLDDRNRPLPGSIWPVIWFPEEVPFVRSAPDKMKAEAAVRYCVGCKFSDAMVLSNSAAMRNMHIGTKFVLCNAYVFTNVPREFPVEMTLGLCSNGYRGLVNQIPYMSRVGWTATPDPHYSGCYIYTNNNMHTFPIPPEFYHRDAPPLPLALAANQSAPASISVPGGGSASNAQKRGF